MGDKNLERVQRLLSKLIRAPEGVAPALPELAGEERSLWEGLIRPHGTLDPVARLDIYANMYFFRIRDALADDFPVLRATIGPERFHNLVTDYLLAHPSRSFTLRDVGASLPGFVRRHILLQDWPWLGDLATLEWAVVEAFDAADSEPWNAARVATVPAEEWGSRRVVWHPSLRVLRSEFPVHGPWQRYQNGDSLGALSAGETWLRVWRRAERVFVVPVCPQEGQALGFGGALGLLAEELAAKLGEAAAAQQLAVWIAEWVEAGLVCGLEPVTCPR
ncbi:hypothetical protein HRbin30_00921 [bacterium HR30]|nr:hypothetical protein HRbin30_00921 [bacterium HR30]